MGRSTGGDNVVAVIGAGPAGLTAAYELAKKGRKVLVFEAGDRVGGMAKTIPLWGQLVDLGPHRFFSSDTRVNRLWLEVIGDRYRMVQRLTRIYYRRTFFDYPLKAFNALRGLGLLEAVRCVLSYGKARLFPCRPESTFDAWVTNRFGERLYGIFFKSYSEKLWGIPCKDLDADFAAQRIKKLSLLEAVKAALFGGGQHHKTLVDEFAYPLDGAGAVYDTMASRIVEMGGEILLRTPVRSVHPASDQAGSRPSIVLDNGDTLHFDHIVSSMPITLLVDRMGAPESIRSRARELRFRNTLLVYLRIAGQSPFPDQWIYVHSPELQTGRITNFRNWLPSITRNESDTIICLEYWCYDDDELWKTDEQHLVALATGEAYKTSLVRPGTIIDGKVVRVPRCYPVYATGYRDHLAPVEQYLRQQPGISVIGRYGAFKYNNQDHSILMGLLAAENILDGTNHDLWAINTDYEYQESSRITATGLSQS